MAISLTTGGFFLPPPTVKSTYDLYVANTTDNPVLTEIEWLASLHGTNAPLTISLFKQSSNGITYPVLFKWTTDKTISSVQLMTNCTGISVTIGATTYDQISLVNVLLPANTEMVINDITIQTGYTYANALIIL